MAELKQCEFFLLRYVPDAVKDEFVNIGVVLTGAGGAKLRVTRDWSRVRCVDPAADVEVLEAIEAEISAQLAESGSRDAVLKRLQDSFSNLLQISGAKACLTEDPQAEIETLAGLYLDSNRRERLARDAGARTRIARKMRQAFEQAGVWEHLWHKVPVSRFTESGDPLKIDCGYRPNGVVRLFHALALESDVNSAKVLAFSYPGLREGIRRKENADTELTALLEDGLDRNDDQIAFALSTLERNSIVVAGVAQLPQIAERARVELKL